MAGGITDATLEEIKARIELSDLVASYGIAVRTAGMSKVACCPFHHEKTPSFHIHDAKGFYHCFGCSESGDAIKFVMKMDGLDFVGAVKKLASQVGVKIEEKAEDPTAGKRKRLYALMAELAQFYHRCLLQTKEAEKAREYLKSRDLGPDVQESFLIGYAPSGVTNILKWAEKHGYTMDDLAEAGVALPPNKPGDHGYHRFGGRLMFTIRDRQGRVVAFSGRQLVASKTSGKYVNSPETLIFKKSNVLFGFDKAAGNIAKSPHHEAIVCEGQIDTIRLHASGFPVAVASQGTAFTEEHVRMLAKVADAVVLVFDDDAAGHKATVRTARLFLAAKLPVRVVSLPGGDDPDSYLRAHPREDFQKLVDAAESIVAFQVRAERAKEANPGSIDAVARVTREVLTTIAQSQDAVLKASLTGEAAKLLGLPSAALQEELGKLRAAPSRPAKTVRPVPAAVAPAADDMPPEDFWDEPPDAADDAPLPGENAATAAPPPPCELEFCAFLMDRENDVELDGLIGEFLPRDIFRHEFTWRFVETWRAECATGEDLFGAFADALPAHERAWFDNAIVNAAKNASCGQKEDDIFAGFACALWKDALARQRGALPAIADAETEALRITLSMRLKTLDHHRWDVTKAVIHDILTERNKKP